MQWEEEKEGGKEEEWISARNIQELGGGRKERERGREETGGLKKNKDI